MAEQLSSENLTEVFDSLRWVSVKPGTPRNTPGTARNIPGTPPEQPGTTPDRSPLMGSWGPGTPLEHPIIPRNTLETARNTPGTPKIVVSGLTAHELTKPKTSEDSQFLIRLLRITLRFASISRMLGIFWKLLRTAKKPLMGKIYHARDLHINNLRFSVI